MDSIIVVGALDHDSEVQFSVVIYRLVLIGFCLRSAICICSVSEIDQQIAGESLLEEFLSYGLKQHIVLQMKSGISLIKMDCCLVYRKYLSLFLTRIVVKNL